MRTKRVWSRSFAAAMAVWFGLVMAAPAFLHSCPQAMASVAAAADAGEGHAAHRAHHSDGQDKNRPIDCQCLGSCAVSTAAALPAGTTTATVIRTLSSSRPLLATAGAAVRLTPDHSQPLATAPPLFIG